MNPRLKTSKKWTSFPKEYLTQVEDVFHDGFKAQLKNAKLVVEGRIYPEEILLRVGVLEKGRLAQANFEVSMNYNHKQKDAVDRIHDCIDAAASMMADYFENEGEVEFPRHWKEYEFNNGKLYLQFTTENSDLESQADAILGLDKGALVEEEQETEDALSRSDETLESETDEDDGLADDGVEEDDEDDDAPTSPTMFGGKKKKRKEDLH